MHTCNVLNVATVDLPTNVFYETTCRSKSRICCAMDLRSRAFCDLHTYILGHQNFQNGTLLCCRQLFLYPRVFTKFDTLIRTIDESHNRCASLCAVHNNSNIGKFRNATKKKKIIKMQVCTYVCVYSASS